MLIFLALTKELLSQMVSKFIA